MLCLAGKVPVSYEARVYEICMRRTVQSWLRKHALFHGQQLSAEQCSSLRLYTSAHIFLSWAQGTRLRLRKTTCNLLHDPLGNRAARVSCFRGVYIFTPVATQRQHFMLLLAEYMRNQTAMTAKLRNIRRNCHCYGYTNNVVPGLVLCASAALVHLNASA
jgi:hypothetical protein